MPTSATGTSTRKAEHGFTLVEILVVLVIVGILAGLAVIGMGRAPEDRVREQARRLHARLVLIQDLCLLEGRVIGMALHGHRVTALAPHRSGWQPLEHDVLRPMTLPEDIRPALYLEGEAVDIPAKLPRVPQILYQADGEGPDYELWLTDGEWRIAIRGSGHERPRLGVPERAES